MLKRILVGGILIDLLFIMVTNVYATTVLPLADIPWTLANFFQITFGVFGIIICLLRAVKGIVELAQLVKRGSDE